MSFKEVWHGLLLDPDIKSIDQKLKDHNSTIKTQDMYIPKPLLLKDLIKVKFLILF